MEKRIITVEGITIDLARLRAVRTSNSGTGEDTSILHLEYNSRTEYSKNPFTGGLEKATLSDTISKKFTNLDAAKETQGLIEGYWSDYMEK